MRKYRRMTYVDRLLIEKLYNAGCSYRAIARKLGFAVSSIHYEVKRGLYLHREHDWREVKKYSATIADDDAQWQATSKGGILKIDKNHAYANLVSSRIKSGESPDQIVGNLRNLNRWTVSTPTLYRYIDLGIIPEVTNRDLWQKPKSKKKKNRIRAAKAPCGTSIERRPESIKSRSTFGHWEMDCVIGKAKGKGQALLVLTERLTRYEIAAKLNSKTALAVENALSKIVPQYPSGTFQTITVDNGSEFSAYENMKQYTGEIYYCHPFSSWERGSNENANRLIRRYLPKGTNFEPVTQKTCDAIADRINRLHRKILGYRTAAECFAEQLAALGTP